MEERLKDNIAILKRHNLTHEPVYHITDGKKHEIELINEIVEDCEKIIEDEEQGLIKRFPCKVGDQVYKVTGGRETEGKIIEGKISMLYCTSENRWKVRFTYQLPSYKTKSSHDLYIDSECIHSSKAEAEKKLKEFKGEE